MESISEERYKRYEQQAEADFAAALGKCFRVHEVTGYRDDDSVDCYLREPVLVRVIDTPTNDLHHWNDEWLDPYWNIEPIESRPELEGVRNMWIFGISYNVKTGERQETVGASKVEP